MRDGKIKEEILVLLSQVFVGLAFEDISSFLHHKRHKSLHKAVKAMSISTDVQRNKLMHLENILVMYRVYNAKSLENLLRQFMPYIAGRHYMKVYLQDKLQQPMKHICKCMAHMEFNIMQLMLCYSYGQ